MEPIFAPVVEAKVQVIVVIYLIMTFPIAVFQIVLGFAAFTRSNSYRAGASTWAGILLLFTWLYDACVLAVRIFRDHDIKRKSKYGMTVVSIILRMTSLAACMAAAPLDIFSGYLLRTTNFSACQYTSEGGPTPCMDEQATCPTLIVPPRTCYCCYLYLNSTLGCRNRFIFDRQTYFSDIRDCNEPKKVLQPLLFTVGCVSLLGLLVLLFSLHHFSPLHYTMKETHMGVVRTVSLNEGEIVNSIRNVALDKLKSTFRKCCIH